MRLFLDTHILLWCLEDSQGLPKQARQLILSANEVYASTANIWEIVIKLSIGKLMLELQINDLLQIAKKI